MSTSCEHFKRPDPDELLRLVESQELEKGRGRLKIFLGYAPRVGKSLRMFDEGARRKSRGQDVLVGAVQAKTASELADRLAQFEAVPPLKLDQGESIDVDTIVKRKPHVCLVDELAYDNPPGGRYPKRWKDVEHLLASGINVVTAVNIQHIEEQQDAIERITGRRAAASVPEAFIRSADEIVIVDVPPEDLAARQGGEQQAPSRPYQLSALREMALLLAAEVVEAQLQRYMDAHGLHLSWGIQERILVGITPRSNARIMLESGRRDVDRFHGHLLVTYVEQPGLNREEQETLQCNLELARKLDAEVHMVQAKDPIAALVDFAVQHRVTQIFVGHSQQNAWRSWVSSPVERLIDAAEGIDVRIFPQSA